MQKLTWATNQNVFFRRKNKCLIFVGIMRDLLRALFIVVAEEVHRQSDKSRAEGRGGKSSKCTPRFRAL